MLLCVFCSKECVNPNSHRNHERTCPKNPNRVYRNGMTGKKGSNQFTKAKQLGVDIPKYDTSNRKRGGCCAPDWHNKEEAKIASAKGGGYRENAGRSKKFKVFDSFGNQTTLQSTYELDCSKLLEELSIRWIRPKALKYDGRNYFADFYLPDHDVWLDPKNDHKAKLDSEKINKVIEQNGVKLYVLLRNNLNKEYILSLLE